MAGNHTLMNNLDSTTAGYTELASPTANGGKGWRPIGKITGVSGTTFIGTVDGQGYVICDLFINRPDEMYVGLFGSVYEGGIIKNIGVVNATVTGKEIVGGLVGSNYVIVSNSYSTGSVTGGADVGGLIGDNRGTVSDCYYSGNVTGDVAVGGLVGWNTRGTVSNSYFSGNVTCIRVFNGLAAGGLVGWNDGATVINSYSSGNVTGDVVVGGLVGRNEEGTVSNSYSTGNVTGNSSVGGLVGDNTGTVNSSFWDIEASGQDHSDGGTGKTTAQMKNIATFSGAAWNIIEVGGPGARNPAYIWNIVNGLTYPFLSWQS